MAMLVCLAGVTYLTETGDPAIGVQSCHPYSPRIQYKNTILAVERRPVNIALQSVSVDLLGLRVPRIMLTSIRSCGGINIAGLT